MAESCNLQRRRVMAGLMTAPMLLLCGSAKPTCKLTVTLTGQALIAHDLCTEAYPGLAEVIAEIRRGDVAITDLETAIRTNASGAPTRTGVFLHEAGLDELRCLRTLGFDMLALANNHAGDLGRMGIMATRQAVLDAGFHAAGSGSNLASASSAGRVEVAGQEVALVAMATGKIRNGSAATAMLPGINELQLSADDEPKTEDVERVHAAIQAAADSAYVIAYLHNHDWGKDMGTTREWARRFARSCIDAGASAFFAHGAPLLQGIELYRGMPILHCLGSLIFHTRTELGHYRPEVWESAIVHLHHHDGRLRKMELVPVVLNERGDDALHPNATRGRPRIAWGADAQRILARLQMLSSAFGTSLRIARGRGWIEVD